MKVSLIGDETPDAFTATFLAAAVLAGAFFAATFLVAGAAAFLATFFAEVGMFLLPVLVSESTKHSGMQMLQRRILQACKRFA
ncbi:hypothetical protein PT2222_190020 [Paraburkholderia tropica]